MEPEQSEPKWEIGQDIFYDFNGNLIKTWYALNLKNTTEELGGFYTEIDVIEGLLVHLRKEK